MPSIGFLSGLLQGLKEIRQANLQASDLRLRQAALAQQKALGERQLDIAEQAAGAKQELAVAKQQIDFLKTVHDASQQQGLLELLGSSPNGETIGGRAALEALHGLGQIQSDTVDALGSTLEMPSLRILDLATAPRGGAAAGGGSTPAAQAPSAQPKAAKATNPAKATGAPADPLQTIDDVQGLADTLSGFVLPPPPELSGQPGVYGATPDGRVIVDPRAKESLVAFDKQLRERILSKGGVPPPPRAYVTFQEFRQDAQDATESIQKRVTSEIGSRVAIRFSARDQTDRFNERAKSFESEDPDFLAYNFTPEIEAKPLTDDSGQVTNVQFTAKNGSELQTGQDMQSLNRFAQALSADNHGKLSPEHALILEEAFAPHVKRFLEAQGVKKIGEAYVDDPFAENAPALDPATEASVLSFVRQVNAGLREVPGAGRSLVRFESNILEGEPGASAQKLQGLLQQNVQEAIGTDAIKGAAKNVPRLHNIFSTANGILIGHGRSDLSRLFDQNALMELDKQVGPAMQFDPAYRMFLETFFDPIEIDHLRSQRASLDFDTQERIFRQLDGLGIEPAMLPQRGNLGPPFIPIPPMPLPSKRGGR